MRDEELKQLLLKADEIPIEPTPDLPQRVRRKRSIRRVRNAVMVAVSTFLGLGTIAWHEMHQSAQSNVNFAISLHQLQQRADRYAAQVEVLEAQETAAKSDAGTYLIEAQREQAATILLNQCDWLAQHHEDVQDDYETLATKFSDTRAGKIAMQKLHEQKEG